MEKRLTRRDFLKLSLRGLAQLILVSMGGAVYRTWVETSSFEVERVRLPLKRLSSEFAGFRVAQISDIHMGGWMNVERLQQVVQLIRAEQPDVVLITGDFIVGYEFNERAKKFLGDVIEVLSPLAASIPTYAVLGNHDWWADARAVRTALSSCGITDLTNSVFTVTRNHAHLHLCGVDDVSEGDVRLDDVIARLHEDSPAILLAHEPDYADISAETEKFDLQVSGHSHGGQIVLPYLGAPILPYLGRKYPSGLYKVGSMYQYTNRGVGMARLPVRWNCPPEITLFVLENDPS